MPRSILTLAITLTAVCSFLASCDRDPVSHGNPKSYFMYSRDTQYDSVFYSIDATTGALDTIPITVTSDDGDLSVSGDGKYLYIDHGAGISEVSTETFAEVRYFPHSPLCEAVSSPNGQFLAILGDSVKILRLPSYEVIYSDTLNMATGVFSADGYTLYATSRRPGFPSDFAIVHLGHVPTRTLLSLPQEGAAIRIVPSPDEKVLHLYVRLGTNLSRYIVYDTETDSVVMRADMPPGPGEIVVTPNGKYVFVSNGGGLSDVAPPSGFFAFDGRTHQLLKFIDTRGLPGPFPADYLPILHLELTPDGKTLIALVSPYGPWLVALDVNSLTVRDFFDYNPQAFPHNIACQTGR